MQSTLKIAARVKIEEALKQAQANEKKAYHHAENGWTTPEVNMLMATKHRSAVSPKMLNRITVPEFRIRK